MRFVLIAAFAAIVIGAGPAAAQQMYVYPSQGQSAEQQQKDKGECYTWAVQQSGFDPATASVAAPAQQAPQGGLVRGAARGALLGTAVGAIAGDTGKGAAIGAASGGLVGGMRRRDQNASQQQAQQQAQANYDAQKQSFERANKACLQGRGYTIQ